MTAEILRDRQGVNIGISKMTAIDVVAAAVFRRKGKILEEWACVELCRKQMQS